MISIRKEKGYVMLFTLVLYAVTFILCASLFTLLTTEIRNNNYIEQNEITTYVAYSGIEHALYILQNESSPVPPLQRFVVFQGNNMTGDYKILELDRNHIVSYGRLVKNGNVICEVTMEAQIDENGAIHIV